MATRFYLPSTGAAVVSPPHSGLWDKTSEADRLQAVWAKISSSFATKACTENSATDYYDVLARQYVIGPVEAVDLSNIAIKVQVRCMEDSVKMDGILRFLIAIWDGVTPNWIINEVESTEFDDEALTNIQGADTTVPNELAGDGDYLVIEIGVQAQNTKTDLYTATFDFGDASGTDLPENETETSQYNPWVEFDATITPYTAPSAYVPKVIMIT